ncbi:hypothetical protein HPB52_012551 [Rhipicephalus sanguineus]|uniref:Tick transposon n=1 Tax=Rhipicephalus sanguineus TaxID=34632 RepID=A0A9D4SX65_RHISA|nr:hypothetical protein HPB52_012551 [Rhipicephalus sanguineus]
MLASCHRLDHVLSLNNTAQGQRLVERLATLPHFGMGRRVSELRTIVPDTPPHRWPVTPPHHHAPLDVHMHIPGIKAKARTPIAAMQQECATLVSDQLCGRLLVYADGSVLPDGSAAAACVAPSLGETRRCRLPCIASSTVAELAAIDLAADLIAESPSVTVARILEV